MFKWAALFPFALASLQLVISQDFSSQQGGLKPFRIASDEISVDSFTLTKDQRTHEVNHDSDTKGIQVHFSQLKLSEGAILLVKDKGGNVVEEVRGQYPKGFWSSMVDGSTASIELKSTGATSEGEEEITVVGYNHALKYAETETTCGANNAVNAICFKQTNPIKDVQGASNLTSDQNNTTNLNQQVYAKASGVAQAIFNKSTTACTGSLLGPNGYFITSAHCVELENSDYLNDASFTFEYQSKKCNEYNVNPTRNKVVGCEYYAFNEALDYVILKLGADFDKLKGRYDHVTLRASGVQQDEKLFVVHHPIGGSQKISYVNDENHFLTPIHGINSTVPFNLCGASPNAAIFPHQFSYEADTEGGSSGAPVFSLTDMSLVALHRCGGCGIQGFVLNGAINIKSIVEDLEEQGKLLPEFLSSSS